DDEDQVGPERANGRERLLRVDVGGLDDLRAEPLRNVVEGALARPRRIDRPGERDDPDDLAADLCARLQAAPADHVEADPDRPHGYSTGSGTSGVSVPSASYVRQTSARKRVITTPARNSPTRGSARSPAASWSASSG